MPSKNVAYIENECQAQDLIYTLADEITGAKWNGNDGASVANRWEEVYRQDPIVWATYKEAFRTINGVYKHTDGISYSVYVADDIGSNSYVDSNGFLYEVVPGSNTRTGKKVQVTGTVTYTPVGATQPVTVSMVGLLLASTSSGVKILKQKRLEIDGTTLKSDKGWNEFVIEGELPSACGDYAEFLSADRWAYAFVPYNSVYISRTLYSFSERYYTADVLKYYEKTVALKAQPDDSSGAAGDEYVVMFKVPHDQYNYFDVYYGKGFEGVSLHGDPSETYARACDLKTVKVGTAPTIINQKEAEAAYKRQASAAIIFPAESWEKDIDGITEIKSPPAHYFFGADSVVTWLANKKRRSDYWVAYSLSINNDRLNIVLEGDPSPDMDAYYRSFAYIGRTVPFAAYDYPNNFGVTVGMGDLHAGKTGILVADINQDTNPKYSGFGRYTSNGMHSMSMLRTRSNVMFQAYYPAFITQLPNYPAVGTLPPELSRLLVEKNGFQPSIWTEKYHASPIYLVHQFEGYRGYLEGTVAINDHNLINGDELVVDTEEWKDPADHSKGTYTEVYKFFSLSSPVNFFKRSANPYSMTIAILKEVK